MDIELVVVAVHQQREADAAGAVLASRARRESATPTRGHVWHAPRSPIDAKARWRWFLHLAPTTRPGVDAARAGAA